MKIRSCFFLKSAAHLAQCPEPILPEFAFVGRSNVGKSSLINSLLQRRIAKTSGTPGKTRLLNFFHVNGQFLLVDVPGYGYAKVSKDERKQWEMRLFEYLTTRTSLRRVFQLIDSRHGPLPADEWMTQVLVSQDIPRAAVLTKCDKISKNQIAKVRVEAAKRLAVGPAEVVAFAMPEMGREELLGILQTDIKTWTS